MNVTNMVSRVSWKFTVMESNKSTNIRNAFGVIR